jgi:hypothetical protein
LQVIVGPSCTNKSNRISAPYDIYWINEKDWQEICLWLKCTSKCKWQPRVGSITYSLNLQTTIHRHSLDNFCKQFVRLRNAFPIHCLIAPCRWIQNFEPFLINLSDIRFTKYHTCQQHIQGCKKCVPGAHGDTPHSFEWNKAKSQCNYKTLDTIYSLNISENVQHISEILSSFKNYLETSQKGKVNVYEENREK